MTLADRIIQHGPYAGGDPSPFTGFDYTDLNQLRDELIAGRHVAEWRVSVVFTPGDAGDPETRARAFAAWAKAQGWTGGPHLHKRTVTVTEWEAVE